MESELETTITYAETNPCSIFNTGFPVEGPVGGIERFTTTLARAFDQSEVQPVIGGLWDFDTPYDRFWVDQLQQHGVPAFIIAPWRKHMPVIAWAEAFRGLPSRMPTPVDIVHSQSEWADPIALIFHRHLGAHAVVRSIHEEVEWRTRPSRRLLLTNLWYPVGFDAEIGISPQIGVELDRRPLARLQGHTSSVITNAIDVARIQERSQGNPLAKRQELGIPDQARLVSSIGRLAVQKGYHVLLEAAAQVVNQYPDVYFVIAGEGEQRSSLEALAVSLGLGDHVQLLGARNDVEQILAASDIFVHSSLWEGLPTAIMEAMIIGTPAVVTRLPGSVELAGACEHALIAEPGDSHNLAETIIQALVQPQETWTHMTKRAREFIISHYSIGAIAQQHVQLYQQLLGIA